MKNQPAGLTSLTFWKSYWITMRPYLLFISASAGMVGFSVGAERGVVLTLGAFVVFFLSYGFGQSLTDYFQLDTDSISSPYRPLVQGLISRRNVLLVSLVGLFGGCIFLFFLNPLTLLLTLLCMIGLATYTYFKRRWWGGPYIIFGALGLGSSNDFHKPFRYASFINGIPARMNWLETVSHDVIHIRYKNGQSALSTRYCIVNASIGITAEANAFYNSRHPFIELIQGFSQQTAIIVSALKSIFSYRNLPCALNFLNSTPRDFQVTNLGVLKNPYFAGNLCYDTPVEADDGRFGVNICYGMTRFEAIKTLMRLAHLSEELFPECLYRPIARIRETQLIRNYATCCMDTSDGLLISLDQLARLNDMGFVIEAEWEKILEPNVFEFCRKTKIPYWFMAAGIHGEFELVFTIPPQKVLPFLQEAEIFDFKSIKIGTVQEKPGLSLVMASGERVAIDLAAVRNIWASSEIDLKNCLEQYHSCGKKWGLE